MAVTAAVAVPPRVTSPVAKSVTGSLKTTVKWIGATLVGSAWVAAWLMVTVGGVESSTYAKAGLEHADTLPAASVAVA